MTRAFSPEPVPPDLLLHLVDLASRAPSAGKAQGWDLLVLTGDDVARYWDITLPEERRAGFRWQQLLDAPVLALPFADPAAYVSRYAEPDKARTGLGESAEAWSTPYWTIDASMAVMTLLLAAEDAGLGALFFGVFDHEPEVRAAFGVPDGPVLLGAIALGRPLAAADTTADAAASGRSAARARRRPEEIVRWGRW